MKVAVLGLGEAGSIYSAGFLANGWEVTGFDPGDIATPAGVRRFTEVRDAVDGADLVISLTSARAAERSARDAATHLGEGAVYADMNSASAAIKSAVADVLATADGALFADVAVLGSVPANGPRAALVISGPGSSKAAELFASIGAPVDDIGGRPGDAARRKLLRSSFMKGLGALIVEATEAGIAAGAEQWLRDQIAAEITGGYDALDRLHDGTRKHAARRSVEAAASVEMLDELGVPPVLGRAVTEVHQRLADENGRSSDELLTAFAGLPVANIGDARDRLGMMDSGIRPLWKGARAVGRARTVWTRAGDNKALREAIEKVQPGEVIVVNGHGDPNRALMGELMAERARTRGCVGMVIDGAARDAWIPVLMIALVMFLGRRHLPRNAKAWWKILGDSAPQLGVIGVTIVAAFAASNVLKELGLSEELTGMLEAANAPAWLMAIIVGVVIVVIAIPLTGAATMAAVGGVAVMALVGVGIPAPVAATAVLVFASTEGASPPSAAPIYVASGIARCDPAKTFVPLLKYFCLPILGIGILIALGLLPVA